MVDVIGIRIAALFISFAAFCSTSAFSYLIYNHNRTVSRVNDDLNKRAEMFKELQFASSNYSIIEFKDKMALYSESERYVQKYINKGNITYHIFASDVDYKDVLANQKKYLFFTLKIPFEVVEGKVLSSIKIERLRFERTGVDYFFDSHDDNNETITFLLYDEAITKRNVIINLVTHKTSDFFDLNRINNFSKLKIHLKITSLLGVEVRGVSELYFTNPEILEKSGINSYWINGSNFKLTDMPRIGNLYQTEK